MPHRPARAYYLAVHAEYRHATHNCTHGPLHEPVAMMFSYLDGVPITWVTRFPECLLSYMDRFGAKFLGLRPRPEWRVSCPPNAADLLVDGEPHDT